MVDEMDKKKVDEMDNLKGSQMDGHSDVWKVAKRVA